MIQTRERSETGFAEPKLSPGGARLEARLHTAALAIRAALQE
jgi:hypothetical protein